MRRAFATLALSGMIGLLCCGLANAQVPDAKPDAGDEAAHTLDTVTVTARRSIADRFNAPGSLFVMDRKDIEAIGGFSVADLLTQLPSVQVTPTANGDVIIRMRGMDPGATQLLVDGQRVSSGKTQLPLDQMPTEMVERIEVVRAPSAEFSGASGGTINIVLRAASAKRETTLRLTDNHVWGRNAGQAFFSRSGPLRSGSASLPAPDRAVHKSTASATSPPDAATAETRLEQPGDSTAPDASDAALPHSTQAAQVPTVSPLPRLTTALDSTWTYFVAASDSAYVVGSDTERHAVDAGVPDLSLATSGRYQRHTLTLTPKFTGRLGATDQLTLRGSFSRTHFDGNTVSNGNGLASTGPYGLQTAEGMDYRRSYNQAAVDWAHRLDGAKMESTLHASQFDFNIARQGDITQTGLAPGDERYSYGETDRDRTLSLKSKLTGTESALLWSGGMELEARRLSSVSQSADSVLGNDTASLRASTQRSVLWGQNEWALAGSTTLTAGLRFENLSAYSADSSVLADQQWRIWQPSLHTRTPLNDDLQWRFNLARITREPNVFDLSNRYAPSTGVNSVNNPDSAGNPTLRPEVAWTLDTGFERRLRDQGQMGINLFVRQLQDTLANIVTSVDGRWVQQRANVGSATVWGLESDVKSDLRWLGLARDWTLSAQASLLNSRMTSGPLVDNRISGQAHYTASLNIAKPMRRSGGFFGGATLSMTGPAQLNSGSDVVGQEQARATLDLYLGQVLPKLGYWRISLYNIGNAPFKRQSSYADSNGQAVQDYSSMRLTPRFYFTIGTQFCDAFKPC